LAYVFLLARHVRTTGFGRLSAKAAAKHKGDEEWQNCRFELNQWIHMVLPFFPGCVDSVIQGPEEAKNLAGEMSSA
jgi:hypothetical protein